MTLAASLLLSVLAQQGGSPTPAQPAQQSGLVVEGKPVDLTFPSPPGGTDSSILRWQGLGYLGGNPGRFTDAYVTGVDWKPIQTPVALKPDAVTWRMKVVVFTSVQSTRRGTFGFDSSIRYILDDSQLDEVKRSLARMIVWVTTLTDGQVKLVPEVSVEREVVPGTAISSDFATGYFQPRINGGGYEAEDKVFRGPYQSALYVVPGPMPRQVSAPVFVFGTPVLGVPCMDARGAYAPGAFDLALQDAWKQEVRARVESVGFVPVAKDANGAASGAWSQAASTAPATTDLLLERLKNRTALPLGLDRLALPVTQSPQNVYSGISIETDSEKGEVLRYSEKGSNRSGGLYLPVRADGKPLADLSQTPTLSFWIKSKSPDLLGVTLLGPGGKEVSVSIGRSDLAGLCNPPEPATSFLGDDTWKQVSVDAKAVAAKAGFTEVLGLVIEPTPGAVLNGRVGLGEIVADFTGFRFSADAPQAFLADPASNAQSTNAQDRALFAAQATASSPALVALLIDPSPVVRLNACLAYTKIKDNEALPNLIKCIVDSDPWIDQAGLRALMNQGGDIATVAIQKTVRAGATPLARGTAGLLLGGTKDAKYRADIAPLLIDRNWQNRLAAVKALSDLPGNEAAIIRMAFLDQVEPEIKLAATRSVDPKDEYQERKLQWSAVNEAGDLIRAESDIKLIQSPNEAIRADGYKGVRDDSRTTRLLLLAFMAENPSESHRNALRLAVTDRSPEVRAAALRGFAALEKGAQTEEIANVLEDADPRVQLALQQFSKQKSFALPAKTKELMSASPDEKVRTGLAGLP